MADGGTAYRGTAYRGLRAALAVLVLLATPAGARTLEVGAAKEFKQPAAAAAAAQAGDRVTIQPGTYVDCAVWKADRLVVEGIGDPASVVIREKTCGGKALFITAGAGITIRNLTLAGARVPDANGAGIRVEGRDLTVEGVRFIDNENGILSGADTGTLTVRDSLFERNGSCEKACAHGIYAGHIDLLRIERSRFLGTRAGHHIKSRAARTEIIGCSIEDGPTGTASYEVELPNGGAFLLRDSTLVKGPKADNTSAMIVIGAEGVTQPTPEITIENNKVRDDGANTVFLRNLTATEAVLRGNQFTGPIQPLRGDGRVVAAK